MRAQLEGRPAIRLSFRRGNPFSFLFVRSRRERYLAEYVVREYARGRALEEILDDPYVRNRARPEERARLLERPEVVEAVGEQALADLRASLAAGGPSPPSANPPRRDRAGQGDRGRGDRGRAE